MFTIYNFDKLIDSVLMSKIFKVILTVLYKFMKIQPLDHGKMAIKNKCPHGPIKKILLTFVNA